MGDSAGVGSGELDGALADVRGPRSGHRSPVARMPYGQVLSSWPKTLRSIKLELLVPVGITYVWSYLCWMANKSARCGSYRH